MSIEARTRLLVRELRIRMAQRLLAEDVRPERRTGVAPPERELADEGPVLRDADGRLRVLI